MSILSKVYPVGIPQYFIQRINNNKFYFLVMLMTHIFNVRNYFKKLDFCSW